MMPDKLDTSLISKTLPCKLLKAALIKHQSCLQASTKLLCCDCNYLYHPVMEQPPNSGNPHGDNISNNDNGDSDNNQGTTVPHITQHEEEDSTHSSTASVNNSNNSPQRQAVLFAPPGNQVIFFDPSNNFQAHAGPDVNQPQALQLEGDEADTNQEEPHVG